MVFCEVHVCVRQQTLHRRFRPSQAGGKKTACGQFRTISLRCDSVSWAGGKKQQLHGLSLRSRWQTMQQPPSQMLTTALGRTFFITKALYNLVLRRRQGSGHTYCTTMQGSGPVPIEIMDPPLSLSVNSSPLSRFRKPHPAGKACRSAKPHLNPNREVNHITNPK